MLSREAAAEVGRAYKFLRHAKQMTLREAAKGASISPQYLQNIETGARTAVSREVWMKLATVYRLDEQVAADLLLKASVMTALTERGLTPDQRTSAWNALVAGLAGASVRVETDISREVAKLL